MTSTTENYIRYIYCHPLFDERKCAHRFSYELALAFSQTGHKIERFDYTGTGEDKGEFVDVTLDSLRSDLARYLTDGDELCLIGLRLGASLALEYCLKQQSRIIKLVLLEPIIKGDEYVDYLLRKQRIKDLMTGNSQDHSKNPAYYNIEGFKTGVQFVNQLKGFDLLEIACNAKTVPDVLIVQISQRSKIDPRLSRLAGCLESHAGGVQVRSVAMPSFWERIPIADYQPLTKIVTEYCHE